MQVSWSTAAAICRETDATLLNIQRDDDAATNQVGFLDWNGSLDIEQSRSGIWGLCREALRLSGNVETIQQILNDERVSGARCDEWFRQGSISVLFDGLVLSP